MILSLIPLALSLAALVFGLVYFFGRSQSRNFTRRLLILSASAIISLLLLEIYLKLYYQEPIKPAHLIIEIMRAMNVDADYTAMDRPIAPFGSLPADTLVKWYRALVYTVAPITGFALVYDVVAGVSPSVKLFFNRRKAMFVFSQLNAKSVALAGDIVSGSKTKGLPVIVFSGCNPDSDDEDKVQLLSAAKGMGAVCLDDDLSHSASFRASRHAVFFLMCEDEKGELNDTENLSLLHSLSSVSPEKWSGDRGCNIFFFTNSADTVENVRAIKRQYKAKKGDAANSRVRVHVVRDYAQACSALLNRHPMFELLSADGEPLRIAIFGCCDFSMEMFKSIFWCCQLLDNPLELCLISDCNGDGQGDFRQRIERLSSEIIESCTPGAACLRIAQPEQQSPPYASLSFVTADMQSLDLRDFLARQRNYDCGGGSFALADYNGFFVMSGDDGKNMVFADELRRELSYMALEKDSQGSKCIFTAIQNDELDCSLKLRYESSNSRASNSVRMLSFGSVAQRYSWSSVSMENRYLAHSIQAEKREELHSLPGMDESKDDIYSEWSGVSRSCHQIYKMYSAGLLRKSEPGQPADAMSLASDKLTYSHLIHTDTELARRLTWLEHRRWNAFLRVQGFRAPPGLVSALCRLEQHGMEAVDESKLGMYAYKNVPDRLHPCLVESRMDDSVCSWDLLDMNSRVRDYIDVKTGKKSADTATEEKKTEPWLYGVKLYDSPVWENAPGISAEELYLYVCGKMPPQEADTKALRRLLENACPGISACEDGQYAGLYDSAKAAKLIFEGSQPCR